MSSLCIQTNSLLSLSDFDLGMSFGNFMYSQDVYSLPWIQLIFVAVKVSCHCGIISVFYVTNMTLESFNDSVFCFTLTV